MEYANLSKEDRENFAYNMNALDLLTLADQFETGLASYPGTFGVQEIENDTPLTATAKLYVPRESDINNLSAERIVTVAYRIQPENYTGEENADDPQVERHYVNIHLQFKNGQPEIAALATPTTVMPGSSIGLAVPTVTPGAYEVIGSGWEIYDNFMDAETHQNGQAFKNNATPMYWYQNGVNTTSWFFGISKDTFLRLCSLAPLIVILSVAILGL